METRERSAWSLAWLVLVALVLVAPVLAGAVAGPDTAAAQRPAGPVVQVFRLEGTIDPVAARYVSRVVGQAERRGAEVIVLQLDTPGGFDQAMRQIVQRLLQSSVPTVVHVAPAGARAGSAGVFITLAADVAAMAPGTSIGAAHPVSAGPGGAGAIPDPVMASKITNDAAAYARSLAQQRGRNAEWAEQAVRESASLSASEALRLDVVEEVATDLDDLLHKLDGRRVTGPWGVRALRTRGGVVFEEEMNAAERILKFLIDPNVAYLLFTIGVYAIMAEVSSPGAIVPGVVGSISLLLAFVAFGSLPLNLGGLALLALAAGLLVAEVKVTSHGLLAAGGLVAFVLGSLLLFNPLTPEPLGGTVRLSPWLVSGLAVVTAGLFGWITRQGLLARRRPYIPPAPETGAVAVARTTLAPRGTVHLDSEDWSAESRSGTIPSGERVRVVARRGLTLVVESLGPPNSVEAA